MVLGQTACLSKEVRLILHVGADWLKLTCQSDGGEMSTAHRRCFKLIVCCCFSTQVAVTAQPQPCATLAENRTFSFKAHVIKKTHTHTHTLTHTHTHIHTHTHTHTHTHKHTHTHTHTLTHSHTHTHTHTHTRTRTHARTHARTHTHTHTRTHAHTHTRTRGVRGVVGRGLQAEIRSQLKALVLHKYAATSSCYFDFNDRT